MDSPSGSKPCWYNNGKWHDADNNPVEKPWY
jgi:hypothetical protein